jgi:hypothetical protein
LQGRVQQARSTSADYGLPPQKSTTNYQYLGKSND